MQTRTKNKLEDIALIYREFEQRIQNEFITGEDSLQYFIDCMPKSEWLKRADIYIDGFHNFSTIEYLIIKGLIKYAKSVTIILTTDGNHDQFSLFRKPSEVLRHIEEIANELNISIERQYFKQLYRFNNQDLKHLEQEFDALQINRVACQGHINILESATMREEINEIARRIIVDIRDKQLRYQDIAILYRDESYAYLFDSILPLYNIPYNIDTKRSMTHHPVMEMIRSLIEVIQSNWQVNPMLRLLKTDVLTASYLKSAYLVDLLENFVLERGIYGKRWLDDELFNVEHFSKMGRKAHKLTEDERNTFEQVVKLKKDVIDKIL
ncbi:helicase-exonuclease AddAB subunit AddB, partial [Staphylococcus aureus]|nr:helicase-exonuclease AddAB subunit AddB [Staphylococcus aureus]